MIKMTWMVMFGLALWGVSGAVYAQDLALLGVGSSSVATGSAPSGVTTSTTGSAPTPAPLAVQPATEEDWEYLGHKYSEYRAAGLIEDDVGIVDFVRIYHQSVLFRIESLQSQLTQHWLPMLRIAATRPRYTELFEQAARYRSGLEANLRGDRRDILGGHYKRYGEGYDRSIFKIDPGDPATFNPFRHLDAYTVKYGLERPSWGDITTAVLRGALLRVGDTLEGAVRHPLKTVGMVALTIAFPEVMLVAFVVSEGIQAGKATSQIVQGVRSNNWNQTLGGWEKVGGIATDLGMVYAGARAYRAFRGRAPSTSAAPRPPVRRIALRVLQKFCFVAGTPVHTPAGLVPIEAIVREAGRRRVVVHSAAERSHLHRNRVVRGTERKTYRLRVLEIRSGARTKETIRTTDDHPFWVVGRGWCRAESLHPDDRLLQKNHHVIKVASSAVELRPGGVSVYNFEVANDHTYFVGHAGVWVHNTEGCNLKRLSNGEIRQMQKRGVDPHDLKPKVQGSRYDLFKDAQGEVYVLPKNGQGVPDPTGYNIYEFF